MASKTKGTDSGRGEAPKPLQRRSFVQSFRDIIGAISTRRRSTVVVATPAAATTNSSGEEVARLQAEMHMAQAKVSEMETKVKLLVGELQQATASSRTVPTGPTPFTLPGAPHKSVLLKGHTASVRFVTQLSHGRVCSASEDKTLRIWNTQTGECESVLAGHSGPVSGVRPPIQHSFPKLASYPFHLIPLPQPQVIQLLDGRICSGSYDKQLIIWNVNMGTIEHTLLGHDGSVRCLTQLADGRIVSGGGGDMKLRVWSASTGQCEKLLAGHTDWVNCVGVVAIPSGARPTQYICTGSNDATVRVWNMASCQCEKVFEGHSHYVTCCLQLQDRLLASLSFDGTIRLWDVTSGQGKSLQTAACRKVITGNPCSTFVGIRLHQLREDNAGYLLAGSDDGKVRVWDPAHGGHLVAELHVPSGKCVIGLWQLADGRIVSSSDDGLIRVWGSDCKAGSRVLAVIAPPA